MPVLVVRTPDGHDVTHEVRGPLVIGRGADVEVQVADLLMSRRHARVEPTRDGVLVEDLGSRNGIAVGDIEVRTARIPFGGRFRIGATTIDVRPDTVTPLVEVDVSSTIDLDRLTVGADLSDANRTAVLLEVARLLGGAHDAEVVVDRIVELAFRIFDIDGAAVVVESDDGRLQVLHTRDRDGQGSRISTSLASQVIRSGKGAIFLDVATDQRFAGAQSIFLEGIRAAMAAPIFESGRATGALLVDNRRDPRRFKERDLEFLGAFAVHAGVALETASLHRRLREEAVQRSHLARFFPAAVAERLLASPGDLAVQDATVTAVFCDLVGYTEVAARLDPRDVLDLLNRWFAVAAPIVLERGGTLEKYIGDALLAVWGAPYASDQDADRALAAARALVAAAPGVEIPGGGGLAVHVGLHTGVVAAGHLGAGQYLQYATIGDPINVAARVCGVAEADQVVVTDATWRSLRDRVDGVSLGARSLKGKDAPVSLWRVVDRTG